LEKVLAKFIRGIPDVKVDVEDVSKKPTEVPAFAPSKIPSSFFRVDVENARPEDILAIHVTFFVEQVWLQDNQIQKWSIQFNRFDSHQSIWVSYPTKRIREDEQRVYYSTVLPGFSLFAITGSTDLPEQTFQVADLMINPSSAKVGQDVTITTSVTNTSAENAVYPANLWLNDAIEASKLVAVGAGATVPVEFTVSKPPGIYHVRVERSFGEFTVGVTPTPTRTPTVPVVTPTLTRTPTVPVVTPTPTGTPTVLVVTPTPTRTPTVPMVTPTSTETPTVLVVTPTPTSTPTVAVVTPAVPTAKPTTLVVTPTATLQPTGLPTPTPIPVPQGGMGMRLTIWIVVGVVVGVGIIATLVIYLRGG
jgi:PGF-pre-PGF domain-containing protein